MLRLQRKRILKQFQEVFNIHKLYRSTVTMYYLKYSDGEQLQGCFYGEELQTVKYPDILLIKKAFCHKTIQCS